MIHLSYEQEITLIKRLVMAQGVSEEDAASLAAVVTHSDFTGTYSHGLSRLCIYLRQYMAGALVAKPDFRCVKDSDASLAFDCGGGSGIVAVNRVYDAVLERARKFGVAAGVGTTRCWSGRASSAWPRVSGATARTSAAAAITATAWQRIT